ncbi:uncharacterized protein [Montipora foliosa]|uniref:uncharacterized protein n=1 Tax=Montipora foliosa TaxID=591990 RepID=UPI0035F0FEB3
MRVTSVNLSSSLNCLSLFAGQDINLSEASGENEISPKAVRDKWWSIIRADGEETSIVYCNATVCSDISCPAYVLRMEMKKMSLILKDVRMADKGLRIQCRIYQNDKIAPLLYNVVITNVSAIPTTVRVHRHRTLVPKQLSTTITKMQPSSPVFCGGMLGTKRFTRARKTVTF